MPALLTSTSTGPSRSVTSESISSVASAIGDVGADRQRGPAGVLDRAGDRLGAVAVAASS